MQKRKILFLVCCALILLVAAGCRLNIIRLNNRIDRWQSMKKKSSVEGRVRFANQSLFFFLTTVDFQRSRETLVTEAERLHYHQRLADMQVFLMDYYAGRALSFLSEGKEDWERAAAEWAKADSLTLGRIPGYPTGYTMVLILSGYPHYLRQISGLGSRYDRTEKQFPGLMEAFRKMSEYQFRLAEHLEQQGLRDNAIDHYLLVFKRDPENFNRADRRIKQLTGCNIREIYDMQAEIETARKSYEAFSYDLYGMAQNQLNAAREQLGDSAEQALPQIWDNLAKYYKISMEQAADIYLYTENESNGTLPEYVSLVRYQILRGQKSIEDLFLKK
ncbi:MAG TPA: hypothetical protein VM123_16950 [archaeon]|nr:hypothetical protein [archaeon]